MGTITTSDLKFYESEEMSDFETGGGQITPNVIVDGALNNVFGPSYDFDEGYGDVSIRQIFASVKSDGADLFGKSRVLLTAAPTDEFTNVLLFSKQDFTAKRPELADYVASYLSPGVESRARLLSDHYEGQESIAVYQDLDAPYPEIGGVLFLSYEAEGETPYSQYVRIIDMADEERDFVLGGQCGTYRARVLVLSIGSKLANAYPAGDITCMANHSSPTIVRETTATQLADYFGIVPLASAVSNGALSFDVESIYQPVVPSSQQEQAFVDVSAGEILNSLTPVGDVDDLMDETWSQSFLADQAYTMFMPRPMLPGSCVITWDSVDYKGDPLGNIVKVATGQEGDITGTINYAGGSLTFTAVESKASIRVQANAAASVLAKGNTASMEITLPAQAKTYTGTLTPLPGPGAFRFEYMVQAKWLTLYDNGNGVLVGDGSGTINYQTGSFIASLLKQPDLGSTILYSWAGQHRIIDRSNDTALIDFPTLEVTIDALVGGGEGLLPGSCQWQWYSGGVLKTATENEDGIITGDAGGQVLYSAAKFALKFTTLPDPGTVVNFTYDVGAIRNEIHQVTETGGTASFSLNNIGTVIAGTVAMRWTVSYTGNGVGSVIEAIDDGAGKIVAVNFHNTDLDGNLSTLELGTIDYATGNITTELYSFASEEPEEGAKFAWFHNESVQSLEVYLQNIAPSEPVLASTTKFQAYSSSHTWSNGDVTVGYQESSDVSFSGDVDYAAPEFRFRLNRWFMQPVVPNSVRFTLGGKTYVDRDGTLFTDIDPDDGVGLEAGTINYSNSECNLTYFAGGQDAEASILGLLTTYSEWTVAESCFRTVNAPIRPGSLFMRCTDYVTGDPMTATAGTDGVVSGTNIDGRVDAQRGVVEARFGYEEGGEWQSIEVSPATIYYNGVAYTSVPLDPEILGLDPTRLPIDGEVPIIETGMMVVVHETFETELDVGVIAGQVVDLEQEYCGRIYVRDSEGTKLYTSEYAVDLTAGTVTFSNPLDLTGMVEPLTVVYRIQDEALVTDVEISGTVTINKPLFHSYSEDAFASTELLAGNKQARVSNVFSQETWTGEWADVLIGDASTATYNAVLFPPEVTNAGAYEDRLAFVFVTTTAVDIIGEHLGVIHEDVLITEDIEVVNPRDDSVIVTIPSGGWGGGWVPGNVVRMAVIAAAHPVDLVRVRKAGASDTALDGCTIEYWGGSN